MKQNLLLTVAAKRQRIILGNNIDVDPTFECHAEQSRSIWKISLNRFFLSSEWQIREENELRVNIYIYYLISSSNICQKFYFLPVSARKRFKYAVFPLKLADNGKKMLYLLCF